MKNIAFTFPGQGSPYVGMSKYLVENYRSAKTIFEQANQILGYNLQEICFNGPFEKLTDIDYLQLSILVSSVAAFEVIKEEIDLSPNFFVGHSFGELSALTCSGAVKFYDALIIAKFKSKYIKV